MNIFIEYKRDDMLCLDNWGCVQLVNVNVLQGIRTETGRGCRSGSKSGGGTLSAR